MILHLNGSASRIKIYYLFNIIVSKMFVDSVFLNSFRENNFALRFISNIRRYKRELPYGCNICKMTGNKHKKHCMIKRRKL